MVEMKIEEKRVRVSATGLSEEGVAVEVWTEGPREDLEQMKAAIQEHFRNSRLKPVPAAEAGAPPAPLPKVEALMPEEAAPLAEAEEEVLTPAEGMPEVPTAAEPAKVEREKVPSPQQQ